MRFGIINVDDECCFSFFFGGKRIKHEEQYEENFKYLSRKQYVEL